VTNIIITILYRLLISQYPNNLFTPSVLKCIVAIISSILIENEKLVLKLFFAKSTKVVKNGSGGESITPLTDYNTVYRTGNIWLVVISPTGTPRPEMNSLMSDSVNLFSRLKLSYKNGKTIVENY